MAGRDATARRRSAGDGSRFGAGPWGRLTLACALALTLLAALGPSAHAYRFNAPYVEQTGPEQTVFDWSINDQYDPNTGEPIGDACNREDIPDAAARAFRDANGNVVLIASHFTTRRFIGTGFDTLQHPCNVVMGSGLNNQASVFDDHEWLSSPYTLDGTNVYALAHEEYQGYRPSYGHSCVGDWTQQQKCWRNSVTLARSANGGATFTSPGEVVATYPYQFSSGIGPYGYFKPSSIVRGKDGYYYSLIRALGTAGTPAQKNGVCIMRTSDLASAASWRAWDGDGFDVSFMNPYTQTGNPADHVCEPVDPDLYTMTSTLVYSTYLGKYVLLDLLNGQGSYNPNPADKVPGIYYSTSDDLLHWTPPTLLMESEIAETHECGEPNPVRVPSLIDHASPERSFDTIGRDAYVYFTRSNLTYVDDDTCFLDLDRDLVRIPVRFTKPTPPTLAATFPATPANNNNPRVRGTAPAGTTVRLFTDADCTTPIGASVVEGTFATAGIPVTVPDDSTTTFHAIATDSADHDSDCSTSSITYVEDSTAPAAPTLTLTTPRSPANENNPRVNGTAESGSTVRLYTDAGCTAQIGSPVIASTFATAGIQAIGLDDDSTTTFYATATDRPGNKSACSTSSITYVEDSSLPGTPTIASVVPASPADNNNPTIKGNAPAGTTVKLFVDADCTTQIGSAVAAGSFATAGIQVSVPNNSTTTFYGTATDQAGNASGCSGSSITYVEDSAAPAAPSLTTTDPASPANDNEPKVIGSAEANSTVKLYGNTSCAGAPLATGTALAFAGAGIAASVPDDSTTIFYATATDQAANTSACSADSVTFIETTTVTPLPVDPLPPSPVTPAAPVTPLAIPAVTDRKAPRMALATAVAKMASKGRIRIRLSCPASEPSGCSGTLRLATLEKVRVTRRAAKRKLKLGSRKFQVAGGRTATVRLTLSKSAKRLVGRARETWAVATIAARDVAGNALTVKANLVLQPQRRKRSR